MIIHPDLVNVQYLAGDPELLPEAIFRNNYLCQAQHLANFIYAKPKRIVIFLLSKSLSYTFYLSFQYSLPPPCYNNYQ